MKRLRIATFNINGINSRLANLLSWLEREAPDVVCLQELKSPDKSFPAKDIEAAGYGVVYPVSYTHLTLPTIYSV